MSDVVSGEAVFVFPILGPESPSRMKRQAREQIARMPSVQDVQFGSRWRWQVRKDAHGRATHLIARVAATSTRRRPELEATAYAFIEIVSAALPELAAQLVAPGIEPGEVEREGPASAAA